MKVSWMCLREALFLHRSSNLWTLELHWFHRQLASLIFSNAANSPVVFVSSAGGRKELHKDTRMLSPAFLSSNLWDRLFKNRFKIMAQKRKHPGNIHSQHFSFRPWLPVITQKILFKGEGWFQARRIERLSSARCLAKPKGLFTTSQKSHLF